MTGPTAPASQCFHVSTPGSHRPICPCTQHWHIAMYTWASAAATCVSRAFTRGRGRH